MLEQLKADYQTAVAMFPANAKVQVKIEADYGHELAGLPLSSTVTKMLWVFHKYVYLKSYSDRPIEEAAREILDEIQKRDEFEAFKAQRTPAKKTDPATMNRN
jgi:hypothetical protein